jgi:ATP-dependent protease ClpP protease subunit
MKHKITGDLTSWNWSVFEFQQKMTDIAADEEITIEMNSYGGDVFLGIDICNSLRSHPGQVTAVVTGIAASAASIAIMGADIIRAYSNTQIMIHHAWTIVAGNSIELRKAADDLDSIGESVLASYTDRVDADQIKKLLDAETFLSAAKAKEIGLIDEIIQSESAEEVKSEIFQDKVKEFNSLIKGHTAAAANQSKNITNREELENMITTMIKAYNEKKEDEFEIPGEKQPGEENPKPGEENPKPSALAKTFLNL